VERRRFLALLGATSAAPLLPLPAAATPVAAGYNRYMYGLAVFQARTRASISSADLIAKLRVSPSIAQAMMAEMSAKGVLKPAVGAASGAMKAVSPNGIARAKTEILGEAVERYLISDDVLEVDPDPTMSASQPTSEAEASSAS